MSAYGMMNQIVLVAKRTRKGVAGTNTFGEDMTCHARVEGLVKRTTDGQGVERWTTARVYLDPAIDIDITDRLTLPSGAHPEIMSIKDMVGRKGQVIAREIIL